MASTGAPTKCEWVVILPDQAGAYERRMKVREQHLSNIKPGYDSGFWLWGGGMLESKPQEGEPLKLNGSMLLAYAETKEEVVQRLKEDVYSANDVWDWDKVQIIPFKSAMRKGM